MTYTLIFIFLLILSAFFSGTETAYFHIRKHRKETPDNIKTILDYSVEGKNDETSFKKTYLEILKNLEEAHNNKLIPFCVFKITGLARFKLLKKVNNHNPLSNKEKVELKIIT